MKGYVAIIVAATLVVCQCVMNKDVSFLSQPKRKCCFPKLASMNMIDLNTVNSQEISILATQIDFMKQRQVMVNSTYNPKSGTSKGVNKVVLDYAKSMLYSVPADYPDRCFKMSYPISFSRCIPDDAEYLGPSYLGPLGIGMLPYDGWRFRSNNGSLMITIAVTKNCVPLVEGVTPSVDPRLNGQLYMISRFQLGLKDPSAFDLPPSCFQ